MKRKGFTTYRLGTFYNIIMYYSKPNRRTEEFFAQKLGIDISYLYKKF